MYAGTAEAAACRRTCAGVSPLRVWGDSSAGGAREYRWCSTCTAGRNGRVDPHCVTAAAPPSGSACRQQARGLHAEQPAKSCSSSQGPPACRTSGQGSSLSSGEASSSAVPRNSRRRKARSARAGPPSCSSGSSCWPTAASSSARSCSAPGCGLGCGLVGWLVGKGREVVREGGWGCRGEAGGPGSGNAGAPKSCCCTPWR